MGTIVKDEARALRAKEIANAIASGRLEGLEPSPGAMEIFQRYVEGELTLEQMGMAIDEYAGREYGPVHLSGNDRSSKPSGHPGS